MNLLVRDSRWSGFYKLSIEDRLKKVSEECGLIDDELNTLRREGPLMIDTADKMTENVIGTVGLPLSVATNFLVDGQDVVVPMAIEEPSVVAAASNAAKLCRNSGGFKTEYSGSVMIGQIQIVDIEDIDRAVETITDRQSEILSKANLHAEHIRAYGGGVIGLKTRSLATDRGRMLVLELMINVSDAMGANAVNTILESMTPEIEELTKGRAVLRILSNLATMRMASATATWKKEDIGGEKAVEAILDAWTLAVADQYRRATHNKGVMNGIDAVVVATGNDWRAVESGAHGYAAMKDSALTHFSKDDEGNLVGKITLPVAVGTVGGSIRVNPTAKIALKILDVKTSEELSRIIASVGLAQNLAALKALATEGIQRGHMRLHARNVAASAGAKDGEIERVVKIMLEKNDITEEGAKKAIDSIR